jgi:hypothetical protein
MVYVHWEKEIEKQRGREKKQRGREEERREGERELSSVFSY